MDPEWLYKTFVLAVRGGKSPHETAQHFAENLDPQVSAALLERFLHESGQIRLFKYPPIIARPDLTSAYPQWYLGPAENDVYWPTLRGHLIDKGMETASIDSIDAASTKVLSYMPSPGLPDFDARGLVIGHVQSGKTANYTALISKAADAGYRFFIVLSGVHNILRTQTQARLNRELVDLNPTRWIPLTEETHDFRLNSAVATAAALLTDNSSTRVIAVIKKNPAVLRKLQKWLGRAGLEVRGACPTLIIDDEADQASINTADGQLRSRINDQLRHLIDALPKVAYVGYTATPFANMFIDPSDKGGLYPRDFIVDLPQPKDYFGAATIFGRDRLSSDDSDWTTQEIDVVRSVPDEEVPLVRPKQSQYASFQPTLTPSLSNAIDYFWMATAARAARGQQDHSSMLIHTTLYADVHGRFQPLIKAFAHGRVHDLKVGSQSTRALLADHWNQELGRAPRPDGAPPTTFDELLPHLQDAIERTEIIIENGRSQTRLSYGDKPKTVIAIGGNTLSRGLTLEGLVVSYFVRTASAYDTLLQMGRWFGYRRGYEDLPRIWMTAELAGWFRDLALVEAEVREDVRRYETEGGTPVDFGVRIRTHPAMAITSELKMQHAVDASMSFSDRLVQTINFDHRDAAKVAKNLEAVNALVGAGASTITAVRNGGRWLLRGISARLIVEFVRDYQFNERNRELQPKLLEGYIQAQVALGELTSWNVAVIGREGASRMREIGGLSVGLLERARIDRGDASDAYLGIITSASDDAVDLDAHPIKDEPVSTEERRLAGPLLLLYPIAKDSKPRASPSAPASRVRVPLNAVDDLVGAAFVFPKANTDTVQHYKTVDLSGATREYDEPSIEEDEAAA